MIKLRVCGARHSLPARDLATAVFSLPKLTNQRYSSPPCCTCEFLPLLLQSCPSLQRCCWKIMLLSLHPNIIVHAENVVSLFSSPTTSSQKLRKCGGHKFLTCEFLPLFLRSYHVQRCCWKLMLLSLHPNIIVHVENVVSLFSSPSTSSQKVQKCDGHKFLIVNFYHWFTGVAQVCRDAAGK